MSSIEALSIDHKWKTAESSRSYTTYVWARVISEERETVKPKESENPHLEACTETSV
jgi:hypothetical protein